MRRLQIFPVKGPNSLWQMYRTISFWRVSKNFIVIQISRYCPFVSWKRWLFRRLLGMEIGENTAFALMAMVDVFYPEKISIGNNSIIGYNCTILTHEYLIKEYRVGEVKIGDNVMIGANSTILPGVMIGDGAVIAAGTVVYKDVEADSFVGSNPLRTLK